MQSSGSDFPILPEASLSQALRWVVDGLPPLAKHHEEIEAYPSLLEDYQTADIHWVEIADLYRHTGRRIVKALALGHLTATGTPGWPRKDSNDTWFEDGPERSLKLNSLQFKFLKYERKSIRPEDYRWNRIDWLKSIIWLFDSYDEYKAACVYGPTGKSPEELETPEEGTIAAFEDVTIATDALCSVFPASTPSRADILVSDTYAPNYRSPFVDLMLRAEQHFGERVLNAKKSEIVDWLNLEGPKTDRTWSNRKSDLMATFLRPPDLQKGGNKKVQPENGD